MLNAKIIDYLGDIYCKATGCEWEEIPEEWNKWIDEILYLRRPPENAEKTTLGYFQMSIHHLRPDTFMDIFDVLTSKDDSIMPGLEVERNSLGLAEIMGVHRGYLKETLAQSRVFREEWQAKDLHECNKSVGALLFALRVLHCHHPLNTLNMKIYDDYRHNQRSDAPKAFSHHIFLSCTVESKDRNKMNEIYSKLKSHNPNFSIKCDALNEDSFCVISDCRYIVTLLSESYLANDLCMELLKRATYLSVLHNQRRVIPVYIESLPVKPECISRLQTIDLMQYRNRGFEQEKVFWSKLFKSVELTPETAPNNNSTRSGDSYV